MRHGMGQPAFLPPKLIDLVEQNALQRSEGPQRKTIKQIIEQEKNLGWLGSYTRDETTQLYGEYKKPV